MVDNKKHQAPTLGFVMLQIKMVPRLNKQALLEMSGVNATSGVV